MESYKREYLGEIDSPAEKDKDKRRFNSKHLRAYIKGFYRFAFGRNVDGSTKYFIVQQRLTKTINI